MAQIHASRLFSLWIVLCILIVGFFYISLSLSLSTETDPPFYVPGEVLIKFRPETTPEEYEQALERVGAERVHTFLSGAERWTIPENMPVSEALSELSEDSAVLYVEPNIYGEFLAPIEPDDALYALQWAPTKIQMPDAWGITIGEYTTYVAVLDSGFLLDHEDLDGNFLGGWDFGDEDNDPYLASDHGTAVAGIIGAEAWQGETPNAPPGVAGMNWQVGIVPLKVAASDPPFVTAAAVAEAIDHSVNLGIRIVNLSLHFTDCCESCTTCNQCLYDAIANAGEHDVFIFAGAGNDTTDIDDDPNYIEHPSKFPLTNIISVLNTDPNDNKVSDSNWGVTSVDLGAPGGGVGGGTLSTCAHEDPNFGFYCGFPGTSSATPHVTGVAALLQSLSPHIPIEIMRGRLLDPNSVDLIESLEDKCVTGGRLNAFKVLDGKDPNAPAQVTNLAGSAAGTTSINLTWTTPGDDGMIGTAAMYRVRYSTSAITSTNFSSAKKASGVPSPDDPNTPESMTVTGLASGTCYNLALRGFDEWGNGPLSNVIKCGTRPAVCTVSYCRAQGEVFQRCTWTSTYGSNGCCQYSCSLDETCVEEDPVPTHACGNYCL